MSSLYPVKRKVPETYTTEFDILKASHKFLRGDEDVKSWDAQLAKKYEDSLFKEFAVCDLKHYKSGNIALRWRTEDEVLSGAGEETCGNTRCPYHDRPGEPSFSRSPDTRSKPPRPPHLTTMELPFSYVERGETVPRQVMVKVVLCERCVKKIMWKRDKEKGREDADPKVYGQASQEGLVERTETDTGVKSTEKASRRKDSERDRIRSNHRHSDEHRSRSKSPRRRRERQHSGHGR